MDAKMKELLNALSTVEDGITATHMAYSANFSAHTKLKNEARDNLMSYDRTPEKVHEQMKKDTEELIQNPKFKKALQTVQEMAPDTADKINEHLEKMKKGGRARPLDPTELQISHAEYQLNLRNIYAKNGAKEVYNDERGKAAIDYLKENSPNSPSLLAYEKIMGIEHESSITQKDPIINEKASKGNDTKDKEKNTKDEEKNTKGKEKNAGLKEKTGLDEKGNDTKEKDSYVAPFNPSKYVMPGNKLENAHDTYSLTGKRVSQSTATLSEGAKKAVEAVSKKPRVQSQDLERA